jgi:hypothetical protein
MNCFQPTWFNRGNTWMQDGVARFLAGWSSYLSVIFCKFLVGASRSVVGALQPLAPLWLRACHEEGDTINIRNLNNSLPVEMGVASHKNWIFNDTTRKSSFSTLECRNTLKCPTQTGQRETDKRTKSEEGVIRMKVRGKNQHWNLVRISYLSIAERQNCP